MQGFGFRGFELMLCSNGLQLSAETGLVPLLAGILAGFGIRDAARVLVKLRGSSGGRSYGFRVQDPEP